MQILFQGSTKCSPWLPLFDVFLANQYLKYLVRQKATVAHLQTYFSNRMDAEDLLHNTIQLQDRMEITYADDPASFIETVLNHTDGKTIVGNAVDDVKSVSAEGLVSRLIGTGNNTSAYGVVAWGQITDYNHFWLSEHIMYGSSRLGLKKYWPQTVEYEWDPNENANTNFNNIINSPLGQRKPWLSKELDSFIDSNETSPWGNQYGGVLTDSRVVGLKRYELNNHLGNVMAVVTDKVREAYKPRLSI